MVRKGKKSKGKENKKELKEQLARALADYDNLRKRVDRERGGIEKLILAKLAFRIIPIFDMLKNVQKHSNDSGIILITEEFRKALADEGVIEIETKKDDGFNEELHEVVEIVNNKRSKKGKIAEVVLTGWITEDGIVIRPTKVKVFKNNRKVKNE